MYLPITATDNWWGTNSDPSGFVSEGVSYDPWLVLKITANPSSITTVQTSAIQANLLYDSNGNYNNPATMHVPDGIPVMFGVSPGSIGHVLPLTGTTANGAATTTFTPATGGTATVSATVDGQQVSVNIVIPVHRGRQVVGGPTPGSSGSSGYIGPAPTQITYSPTLLPTVQQTTGSSVGSSPTEAQTTIVSLRPTNTPPSGIDAVPVIGAIGLCGAIFLFRKNRN